MPRKTALSKQAVKALPTKRKPSPSKAEALRSSKAEVEALRARLAEAEETLRAIHQGEVDAVLVEGTNGPQIYTLHGADQAYQVLVERMNEGALTVDPASLILYANSRLAEMLARPLESVIGAALSTLVVSADTQTLDTLLQIYRQGHPARGEVRLVVEGGALLPAQFAISPLAVDPWAGAAIIVSDLTLQKRVEAILRRTQAELEAEVQSQTAELSHTVQTLSAEIVQRQHAEQALRTSGQQLRTVLDTIPEIVFAIDPAYNLMLSNQAFERITQATQGHPIRLGETVLAANASPEFNTLWRSYYDRALHGETLTMETSLPGANGVRQYDNVVNPIFDSAGQVSGVVVLSRDITERQRAKDRQHAVEVQMQVLHQMDRLRADLVGNVSHELRTPLGVILMMTTALLEDRLGANPVVRGQFLRDIEEEARNLQAIVDQLLDESQFQHGHVDLNRSVRDVRALIRETVERQSAQSPQHHLSYQVPETELLAALDARRIEQVLRNLLDNAVKYAPAGTTISVEADNNGDCLWIAVSDEGPGIPLAEREHIFERFYRINQPHALPAAGLGLGLSISRDIVEAHGGRLWAEDRPTGGSRFVFTLPSGSGLAPAGDER